MIYAVIDTNVLVSALITHNPEASTAKVVKSLLERGFVPIYDDDIIAEYEEVLHRPKFPILPEVANALVSFIVENGIEVSRSEFVGAMPDEDDRVFYEVTLSVDDSFLITGNRKHYPVSPRVVTPAEMLDILNSEGLS